MDPLSDHDQTPAAGPQLRKGIFVLCPTRKELVHTGIWMEPGVFSSLPTIGHTVLCPHCNVLHSWSKRDVILV